MNPEIGQDLSLLHLIINASLPVQLVMAILLFASMMSWWYIFMKLRRQTGLSLNVIIDGTRRAMRATYQRELDGLESHLSFLATVGSVSPYVGLFGTVWGIMIAFMGLSSVAQATLAQVAPGIAEALIATAMGLFAAIPAVVGYNRYTHDIDRLSNRMESFMEEFSNILQRQVPKAA